MVVEVQNLTGFSVVVDRAYSGTPKAPQLWRGSLTVNFLQNPLFDIEVTLVEGRDGSQYVGMPARKYTTPSNETKYKNQTYIHDQNLLAAMRETIQREMGVYQDKPPMNGQPDHDPVEDVF